MDAQNRETGKYDLAVEVLQSLGWLRLRATGSSMLPTLWPGDLLTIRSQSLQQVEPGDIVLWTRGGRFFVHRVVRKSSTGAAWVVTRGDSMPAEDPAAAGEELLGKVVEIRRNGRPIALGHRLSPSAWVAAHVLRRSALCQRLALQLHARRGRDHRGWTFAIRRETS
jgi:hypothetical protein